MKTFEFPFPTPPTTYPVVNWDLQPQYNIVSPMLPLRPLIKEEPWYYPEFDNTPLPNLSQGYNCEIPFHKHHYRPHNHIPSIPEPGTAMLISFGVLVLIIVLSKKITIELFRTHP
jgi:hypothetical protein